MKFEKQELDKKTLDRLRQYRIILSSDAPPVNKEKALVLIGQAMLDRFVKEFVSLWKNELFPNCLLRDYEASDEEVHRMIHGDEPWDKSRAEPAENFDSCSNNCKEVMKMDENTKQRLGNYLELLDGISEKTDDERTAVALLQEISKDRRMEQIMEKQNSKNGEAPATDKQKKFMEKLGIDFPETVTKKEASVLIDEELGKNGE